MEKDPEGCAEKTKSMDDNGRMDPRGTGRRILGRWSVKEVREMGSEIWGMVRGSESATSEESGSERRGGVGDW